MVADAPRNSSFLVRFVEWLIPCAIALGMLVRARVLFGAPMPPASPARWLLAGLADDVAVIVALALLALLLIRRPRAGAVLFGAVVGLMLIGQLALSEATVFFGHAMRGEDLETGLHPRLLAGSMAGGLLLALLLIVAATGAATIAAWRLAPARRSALTLGRLAALAVVAVVATIVFPPPGGRETARNALFAAPSMFEHATIDGTPAAIPDPRIDVRLVRELAPRHASFISDAYPLAHVMPPRSPSALELPVSGRPNFVFILLESMRAEEVGAYGNDPPGLTPNLDQLARDGIRVDRVYSAGGLTPEGELGVLYGALTSPNELLICARPGVRLAGFPEILRRNGWRSILQMSGCDRTLYLGGRFYRQHGLSIIDGRDLPADDPQTNWGISDRAVLRHAVGTLGHLDPPFAAMIVTISNHHPFELPPDALTLLSGIRPAMGQMLGHSTQAMLRTMHYADQALGEFFRAARTQPWFGNTIFVICGDHGTFVPPVNRPLTRHVLYELRHRIPLIIYSPRLAHGVVIHGPASQTDVLPTLLAAAHVPGPIAGTGIDLLDPAQRDEARPIVSWELFMKTITVNRGRFAYHATGPQLTDELLVDTEADPDGRVNLIARQPDVARACRRAATIYLQTYGWLVAHDRAGAP